eukprot:2571426-Amphidinium_carterae.1
MVASHGCSYCASRQMLRLLHRMTFHEECLEVDLAWEGEQEDKVTVHDWDGSKHSFKDPVEQLAALGFVALQPALKHRVLQEQFEDAVSRLNTEAAMQILEDHVLPRNLGSWKASCELIA